MSYCTLFHLSWSKEMQWCHGQGHWCHVVLMALHDQKSHVAPHFNYLNLRNRMVPLIMPSASCDAHASANGITWPKSLVALQFHHLGLRNAMVWLMMLFAPHDADVSTNGIIGPKMLHYTSLWLSWPRKWMVPLTVPFGINWHWCQWHHMIIKSYCISFWLPWPGKCSGSTDDAITSCDADTGTNGITWLKVLLHLI